MDEKEQEQIAALKAKLAARQLADQRQQERAAPRRAASADLIRESSGRAVVVRALDLVALVVLALAIASGALSGGALGLVVGVVGGVAATGLIFVLTSINERLGNIQRLLAAQLDRSGD